MIVVWRVTTHCNLRCGFCAYDRSLTTPRSEMDPASVLRFARLLAEYQTQTARPVMISWLGGEPLLWKPLAELSGALSSELGLRLSATTNGTALKSVAIRQTIARCFDELTVSVDGPPEFHDQIRHWPDGFEQLRDDVKKLRAESLALGRKLRLRVNTVLMASNVSLFATLCEQLTEWGIDEITFNQLGGNDRPEFHRQHHLRLEDIAMFEMELPKLRHMLSEHGIRLAGTPTYLQRFRASASSERLPVSNCRPGRQFLFIDEQGRIAPCSFTVADYSAHIDELHSVDDLIALGERYEHALTQRRSRWCDDCPSTQVFEKFVA